MSDRASVHSGVPISSPSLSPVFIFVQSSVPSGMTTPCCAVQKQINWEFIKDSMSICWTDHLKWTNRVSKSSKKQCWVYLFVCLFKPVSVHNTKIMSLSFYLWFKTLSFLKPTLLVNFYMANFIWIHSIKMARLYFGQWRHCPHCCSLTLVPTWWLQSSRPSSPSHALLPLPPNSTITSHPSQGPLNLVSPCCSVLQATHSLSAQLSF